MKSKEKSWDNFSWNNYDKNSGSGDWSDQEQEKSEISTCPSCGAEIIADKNTAATSCVYCGNPTIIEKRLSGLFRPDYVIPFKIDKETAQKKILEFCKNKIFLPKKFIKEHAIEELKGMYVPFWLFGCDTSSEINYNAVRTTFWSDSKYNYEKSDYYLVIREGDMSFENVPVDTSQKNR